MLKLSLRPGEFIDIGENVRVIFSGGSANNIHLLVDAPREINIARRRLENILSQTDEIQYAKEQCNQWQEIADYTVENTVMVHIRHIREKIEINPREPRYLKVVWGLGYKVEKI